MFSWVHAQEECQDKRSHRRDRAVDENGVLHLIEDNTGGNPAYVGRYQYLGRVVGENS